MSENEEYPSNSQASRMRPSVPVSPAKPVQQPQSDDHPKAEKAIEGTATVKKRTLGSKFKGIFTSVSPREIFEDVIDKAIIPGINGMLRDAGERALDRMFGGGTGTTPTRAAARTMVTNVAHVAYNQFAKPNNITARPADPRSPVMMTRRGQAMFDFEELEFETRKDASIILDLMYDRLQNYGSVSVAEFYGWADVRGHFTDNNYGWRDLTGAGPTRNPRTGRFVLNLPDPIPLTS